MQSSSQPRPSRSTSAATLARLSSTRRAKRSAITRSTTRTATATARTQTRQEDAFIVAVIDNTEKDVGFSAYNLNGFDVQMRQFSDSNTYTTLTTILCVFAPVEILMSLSSAGGLLDHAIKACPHLANTKQTFVGRTYFNETYGALVAEKLSYQVCPTLTRLGESSCYLALACSGALIRYLEHVEDLAFAPSTLRIRFQPNDSTVFLDMSTLEGLEVVSNARAINGLQGPLSSSSLLRVLDNTKTRAGKRFLRRSLLEPCADIITVSMRQQAVEELGSSEEIYFALAAVLSTFPDLERAMAALMTRENARLRSSSVNNHVSKENCATDEESASSDVPEQEMTGAGLDHTPSRTAPLSLSVIENVLIIKLALESIKPILETIQESRSPLLRAIAESMRSSTLHSLHKEIAEVVDIDATPAKDCERKRMNAAFAVKAGRNGRLDTARKILSENIEDMQVLTDELRNKYGLYKIELCLHAKRGYHFSIPTKFLDYKDFPEEFIQISEGKKIHRFSSEELGQLNLRYHDSLQQIWRFTDLEVGSLLNEIFAPNVLGAIHRLCDSVAILDCLTSFVTYASLCQIQTVRPKLSERGPIAFQQAYHPILCNSRPQKTVPNDVFLDETTALHVISGRNQAGKSTYIRKVGLLCIMAHTGCNVPAKYASVQVLRRIVTAFGLGDEISQSQSHFSKEMSDVSTIFDSIFEKESMNGESKRSRKAENHRPNQHNVPNTLVLIDELGRSTSTLDGFAIAYAVAEKLAACRNVLTLFATHFLGIGCLSTINPVVKNFNIGKIKDGTRKDNPSLDRVIGADYKLAEGVVPLSSYGIETARLAGFPSTVIENAMLIRDNIPVRRIVVPAEFAETHLHLTSPEKLQVSKLFSIVSIAQRLNIIDFSTTNPVERERLYSKVERRMKKANVREPNE